MKALCTVLACLVPALALAAWDGAPWAETVTNYGSFAAMVLGLDAHPMQQLVDALNERRAAAGLAALSITRAVTLGTNNVAATLTNTWGQFEAAGYTGRAAVVSADVAAFDAALWATVPYYVDQDQSSGGTLAAWCSNNAALPVESQAGILSRLGIGLTTNLTTNATGFATGGVGMFTRTPGATTTGALVLAQLAWQPGRGDVVRRGHSDGYGGEQDYNTGYCVAGVGATGSNYYRGAVRGGTDQYILWNVASNHWVIDNWLSEGEVGALWDPLWYTPDGTPYTTNWLRDSAPPYAVAGYTVSNYDWTFSRQSTALVWPSDTAHYHASNALPVVQWQTANGVPACTVTVFGVALAMGDYSGAQGEYLATGSVAVVAGATNTPCAHVWNRVYSLECSAAGGVGDVVIVAYTNALTTYGAYPYWMHAEDFTERQRVVDHLRWTYNSGQSVALGGVNRTGYGDGGSFPSSWASNVLDWVNAPEYTTNAPGLEGYQAAAYYAYAGDLSVSGDRSLPTNAFPVSVTTTNYAHAAQVYMAFAPRAGASVNPADIDGILPVSGTGTGRVYTAGRYYLIETNASSVAASHTVAAVAGVDATANPVTAIWPATNSYDAADGDGYSIRATGIRWVFDWSGSNGFDYVE